MVSGKKSCETQLLNTIQTLAKQLNNKSQIDTVLLDCSKAFHKVPQKRLQYKLKYYGISGSINRWISDFLVKPYSKGNTRRVFVWHGYGRFRSATGKCPWTDPITYIYINIYDLPDYITNGSSVKLFAEDSILSRKIKSEQDAINLQQDLYNLQQ